MALVLLVFLSFDRLLIRGFPAVQISWGFAHFAVESRSHAGLTGQRIMGVRTPHPRQQGCAQSKAAVAAGKTAPRVTTRSLVESPRAHPFFTRLFKFRVFFAPFRGVNPHSPRSRCPISSRIRVQRGFRSHALPVPWKKGARGTPINPMISKKVAKKSPKGVDPRVDPGRFLPAAANNAARETGVDRGSERTRSAF